MFPRSKRMLDQLLLTRRICTTAQMQAMQPSLVRLRKLQAKYQEEDGKPVWLKAGFRDRILYMGTWIGIFIGLPMTFKMLFDLAKPPSWRVAKEEDCD